jgi:hypothetical protein
MDPLIVARRLPRIAERAMRAAIRKGIANGGITARALVGDALAGFDARVARELGAGPRSALLFAERNRIARELRAFAERRLAARLCALRRRDVIAVGADASPFDAVVRNRRGRRYAIVLRRLPCDGTRLELLGRMRIAAKRARTPVDGVLVYDFGDASVRLLNQAGAERVYGDLRAS